jgi:hypothetical protein
METISREVQMEMHLRGNFYPPLPLDYAKPALEALAHYEAEDFDAVVVLPADIEPHPACATKTERGWELSASDLIRILRLDR